REGGVIAEDAQANALAMEAVELALDVEAEQAGELGDLGLGPTPVLRGEGIERQALDPGLARRAQRPPRRLRAGAVAGRTGQPARLRPAAIAVHDDGDVPGHRRRRSGPVRLGPGRRR